MGKVPDTTPASAGIGSRQKLLQSRVSCACKASDINGSVCTLERRRRRTRDGLLCTTPARAGIGFSQGKVPTAILEAPEIRY